MSERNQSKLAKELGKRGPFATDEQEAYIQLLRTADRLSGGFSQLYRQHGITGPQYNALRILRGHGTHVATRKIAAQMVTREPDITRLVDRLVKCGLAERERCEEDRRVVWVSITQKGLDLLAELDQPVLDLHHAQLGHLSREKLRLLSELLAEAREGKVEG